MSDQTSPASTVTQSTQPDSRSLEHIAATWAGGFSISIDSNEFMFLFSQPLMRLSPSGATEMPLVPTAAIVMSPVLAKDFLRVLQESVTNYEKQLNTTIPSPRQLSP